MYSPSATAARVRALVRGLCALFALMTFAVPIRAFAASPDLHDRPTGADSVRGSVVDSAGHAIPGAIVTLVEANRAVVVARNGTFVFADVPAGQYTLTVSRAGYAPLGRQLVVPASDLTLTLHRSSLRLEPVNVTATRTAIDPGASPFSATALSGERLRREHEVSLAHALDGLSGIRTLSTGEQVGKPIIRGLTGPRVLVLDNSLRLEDYSWSDEDGPSVDSRMAQRIEVIRGPASILYGSDAIGGVINVLPDEVPDARGRAAFTRSAAELYGATNNSELGGVLRAEGADGAFGWRAVGIGRTAGNLHTPTGNPDTPTGDLFDTGFHALNGELAIGAHGEKANATLRYERYGGNFGLLDGPPVEDDNTEGPQRRLSDDRIQGTTNWLLGNARLETRSQWQRHSLQEVVGESRVGAAPPIFDLLLNTFTTDIVLHHATSGGHSGAIGLSGLIQDNTSTGQVPLVPNAREASASAFALEQMTSGAWSVLAGVRGDARHISTDPNAELAVGNESRSVSAVTGDVGAIYRPTSSVSIAANVGRAFRAPTLFELFTNGPHLGEDRFEIGLPSAHPEVSLNTDASLRWETAHFHGEISAYRNQIDHYLYIQATGNTRTVVDPDQGDTLTLDEYRNLQTSRAVLTGLDVSSELEALPALTVRGRFDLVRGTNDATGEPLPLMPPPRVDLEAELHTVSGSAASRAYVSVGTQTVARQNRLGPFDTPTDAYTLVHLGAGIGRDVGGREFVLDLRVRNAADTKYADFLSRYKSFAYAQGRNVVIRLSTGF